MRGKRRSFPRFNASRPARRRLPSLPPCAARSPRESILAEENAMSNREFFLERWQAEHAPTLRVLKAVPAARLDYRPHAKSRSAGELVQLLVYEEETGIVLCEQGEIRWKEPKGIQ